MSLHICECFSTKLLIRVSQALVTCRPVTRIRGSCSWRLSLARCRHLKSQTGGGRTQASPRVLTSLLSFHPTLNVTFPNPGWSPAPQIQPQPSHSHLHESETMPPWTLKILLSLLLENLQVILCCPPFSPFYPLPVMVLVQLITNCSFLMILPSTGLSFNGLECRGKCWRPFLS